MQQAADNVEAATFEHAHFQLPWHRPRQSSSQTATERRIWGDVRPTGEVITATHQHKLNDLSGTWIQLKLLSIREHASVGGRDCVASRIQQPFTLQTSRALALTEENQQTHTWLQGTPWQLPSLLRRYWASRRRSNTGSLPGLQGVRY